MGRGDWDGSEEATHYPGKRRRQFGCCAAGGGGQEGLCLGYREVLLITLTGGSSESCEGGGQLWMTAKLFFF